MVYMASACLVGVRCRYDGGARTDAGLKELFDNGAIIPFCPETAGGLGIPRPRLKIVGCGANAVIDGKGKVLNEMGEDKTPEILSGAVKSVAFAEAISPKRVFLKSGSPSCGVTKNGIGVTAELFRRKGFELEERD